MGGAVNTKSKYNIPKTKNQIKRGFAPFFILFLSVLLFSLLFLFLVFLF